MATPSPGARRAACTASAASRGPTLALAPRCDGARVQGTDAHARVTDRATPCADPGGLRWVEPAVGPHGGTSDNGGWRGV